MKRLLYILLFSLIVSCNYFENKKIKVVEDESHELVQDKLKDLDRNKIDRYPVFKHCESLEANVEEEKICFINTLSKELAKDLVTDSLVFKNVFSEKIKVYIKVENNGDLILEKLELSDSLHQLLPNLKTRLEKNLSNLPEVKPALKYLSSPDENSQGEPVEVTTHFVIPIRVEAK